MTLIARQATQLTATFREAKDVVVDVLASWLALAEFPPHNVSSQTHFTE
jgi:hypothetical protein